MKTNNEIITAIQNTLKKAGEELTETQSALLSGCLFIWLDKVRAEEREKMKTDIISIVNSHPSICQEIGDLSYYVYFSDLFEIIKKYGLK